MAQADLAFNAEAHSGLFAAVRKRSTALRSLLAHHADNPALLEDVHCLGTVLDLNLPSSGGMPPLIVACLQGSLPDVTMLLDAGANPATGEITSIFSVFLFSFSFFFLFSFPPLSL